MELRTRVGAAACIGLACLTAHGPQTHFTTILGHRGYEGSFHVDYESGKLALSVNTNKDGTTNPETLKALSGIVSEEPSPRDEAVTVVV